jgi:TRAP-type C4-dicarboxylate transport system permease small subunit
MTMPSKLDSIESVLEKVSQWFNRLAIVAMAVLLVLTVIDVVGAKVFRWPLPGAVEVTSLVALIIAAFALPLTQMLRGHIEIEIFVIMFSKRVQAIISCVIALLALALFIVITWQIFDFSRAAQLSGRVTPTQEIPLYPFTYGAVICFFMVCPILILQFLKALKGLYEK